jgi:hypothetical protein
MGASNQTQTVRNEVDPWTRAREDALYTQASDYASHSLANQNNPNAPQNIPGIAGMNPLQRSAQEFMWNQFAGGQGSGIAQAQQAANVASGITAGGAPMVNPMMLGGPYGGGGVTYPGAPTGQQGFNWGSPFTFSGFPQGTQPYAGGITSMGAPWAPRPGGFTPDPYALPGGGTTTTSGGNPYTPPGGFVPGGQWGVRADSPSPTGYSPGQSLDQESIPADDPAAFAAQQDALWNRVWAAQDAAGVPREVRNPGQTMSPSDPRWTSPSFSLAPFQAANPSGMPNANAGGGATFSGDWLVTDYAPTMGPGIPSNPWDPTKGPGTPAPPIGTPPGTPPGTSPGGMLPGGAWGPGAPQINAPQAGYAGDVSAQQVAPPYWARADMIGAERLASGNVRDAMPGYQNLYDDQVVGTALSDIDRSRQLAQGQNASMATQAGAFGGDRHAIVEAETNRAYADQAARTAAQLRSQGFDKAAGLAQQDASRQLAAGQSNQSAGLQAGLANQATMADLSRFNSQAGLQSALANQSAGLQASLANQGTRQGLGQFNAALGMDAARANQSTTAQYGLADQATGLQASLANQNAWFQGRNQQLQGAGLLSSFGGDVANRTLGTGTVLSGIGDAQQGQQQAELDDYIARMYERQNIPLQQFGMLQGMLSGFPAGMTQIMSQPRNRGAGALGGAMSGAAIGTSIMPGWGTGIGAGIGGLLGLF